MFSKVVFFALVALVAQALAGPEFCPDPSAAKEQVYNGVVHGDKPLFGRVSKEIDLKTEGKVPTCILVTGFAASESKGVLSLTAIGISKEGDVSLQLVSTIKNGIDVVVEVYTE
ncbi:uncharacterized protein LOC108909107 [Anoplophora glabripennis]|uniref:uncharacterized protein LOC108909107 n=1 Tax=Anoplophora glabripennis TaxID=217634 RepID=UPI0008745979|nr:uncharacterized protein LOC108909107 [Anoplophora glabripennis]